MVEVRVDAARRDEAEKMHGGVTLLGAAECAEERLVGEQRAILHRPRHAHEVLEEDPSRADREVAHLRVAHLALGQADGRAGGTKLRRAVPRDEVVEARGAGERDRVSRPGRRDPPTVQDREDDERRAVAHEPAARQIAAKESGSSDAPPTSAPSTAGCAISSAAFSGFTEPP